MYFELKENKPHGTKDDPFSTYHIKNEGRSFQIPVHWHDELEIIYVKSGFLTVSISGENYIGTPGDAFVVLPGNSWVHRLEKWIILLSFFHLNISLFAQMTC